VQEELVIRLPTADLEKLFETVIAWGRYAEIINYAPESDEVFLDQPT
jgi:hypothetical protein